jgi:hypothetical protein
VQRAWPWPRARLTTVSRATRIEREITAVRALRVVAREMLLGALRAAPAPRANNFNFTACPIAARGGFSFRRFLKALWICH